MLYQNGCMSDKVTDGIAYTQTGVDVATNVVMMLLPLMGLWNWSVRREEMLGFMVLVLLLGW